MDASVRASRCTHTYVTHARVHVRTHAHGWLYLCRVGKRRRTRRLKKGAICRAMAGTPCAWEYWWGYIYTPPLSLSDTFFAPRRIFFSVASSCLRAYDAASSLRPANLPRMPPLVRLVRPSAFVTRRHVEREGFYFKYFQFRWRDFVDGPVYEWNGAIGHAETVKRCTSRDTVLNIRLCRMICKALFTYRMLF